MDPEIKEAFRIATENHNALVSEVRSFVAEVREFAASSNTRMSRIEDNLADLIRAITLDHSNGKGKIS